MRLDSLECGGLAPLFSDMLVCEIEACLVEDQSGARPPHSKELSLGFQ